MSASDVDPITGQPKKGVRSTADSLYDTGYGRQLDAPAPYVPSDPRASANNGGPGSPTGNIAPPPPGAPPDAGPTPDPYAIAPPPPGMSQADYYAALARGGQNEQAAATAAGNHQVDVDSADPNSMASHPTDPATLTPMGIPSNTGALSGPGPYEQWAAEHAGAFDNKSAAETLYDQGMAGTDPYYKYATDKATQSINDAAAARGNWNSSAALYDIGNQTANLRGQQAAGMKDEANSSDAAYNARVTGAENLYGGWQAAQEGRLGGAQSTATTLGQDQANLVTQAYQKAGDLSNTDNLEAFNAQLQKLGIDPKSSATQDLIKILGSGAQIATAAAK